jgi:hypothetical protein
MYFTTLVLTVTWSRLSRLGHRQMKGSLNQTLACWRHFDREVFGYGTPPGGSGIDIGKRLKEHDIIELDIEGIGILRNPVGKKAQFHFV